MPCPKCGTLSGWKKGERKTEILPNGEEVSFDEILGLECPKCKHLFKHPAETKALWRVDATVKAILEKEGLK
jgi:phage FluMu protein Com